MPERFNLTEVKAKLAEIKADQPPEFLMTEEQFKQAVINNLPKSTICPKHNCAMELFEGIGKTGNPYRAYKCGISSCKEILWTDREAETINAEVKDIEAFLGIQKPAATAGEGQLRKEKSIAKHTDRKENSIVEAAIRRDAVIFAVAEFPSEKFNEEILTKGKTPEIILKELHQKWLLYFETLYKK